jgi:hypothetical protein
MKAITFSLLAVGALPLLAYPAVILANVMSLAGHRSGDESPVLMLVVYTFLLASTAYPVVYVFCFAFAIARVREKKSAAIGYGLGPIGYLAAIIGLGALWAAAS